MMKKQEVIYEEKLKIGLVLKFILIFMFGLLIGLTVWYSYIGELGNEWISLVILLSTAILLSAVVPRKYQIFSDRMKVVCGLLRINILFDDIETIETRPPHNIYGSLEALRFGTGTGEKCVMIKREQGMNILIQPMNTERFMEVLNNMMKKYRRGE